MKTKVLSVVFNICSALLFILYVPLSYLSLSLFPFIPWYSEDMSFAVIVALIICLPLAILTLAIFFINIVLARYTRAEFLLPCTAAICLPLMLASGYADLGGKALMYVIASLAIISSLTFFVLTIVKLIKAKSVNTNEE